MSKTFSKRLEEEREERGWTKAYVAEKVGVNYSTYNNWEYSGREPKYEDLVKLAELFGVTTDYLLGKTDVKNTVKQPEIKAILNLSDEDILKQYQFLVDDKPLSEVQMKRLIAFIRAERDIFK